MSRNWITLIFLLMLILSGETDCSRAYGETRGEEELQPIRIGRLAWLNNREILVADYHGGNKTRLIKFNVIENKFTPVFNSNFRKNIVITFTNNGKTWLVYDKDSDMVSFISGQA